MNSIRFVYILTLFALAVFALSITVLVLMSSSGDALVNGCGSVALIMSFFITIATGMPVIAHMMIQKSGDQKTSGISSNDLDFEMVECWGTSCNVVDSVWHRMWAFVVILSVVTVPVMFIVIAAERNRYRGVTITAASLSGVFALGYFALHRLYKKGKSGAGRREPQ